MTYLGFISVLAQLLVTGLIARRIVCANYGNIVYLPAWRLLVNRCLDAVLISFSLCFLLTREPGAERIRCLTAAVSGGVLAVLAIGKLVQLWRRRGRRSSLLMQLSESESLPQSASQSRREMDYLKVFVTVFYKIALIFWCCGCIGAQALPSEPALLAYGTGPDAAFLEQYMAVVAVLAAWCTAHDLWRCLAPRAKNPAASQELEQIRRKIQETGNLI